MKRRIQSMSAGVRRRGKRWIAPLVIVPIVLFTAFLTLTGCVKRQVEASTYGADSMADAAWIEEQPFDPDEPEFVRIVERRRHSAYYAARVDLADGETVATGFRVNAWARR